MGTTEKKRKRQKQVEEPEQTTEPDVVQQSPEGAAGVPSGGAGARSDTAPEPDADEIARLAYSYWEARGGEDGRSEDDWLRAERELRAPP